MKRSTKQKAATERAWTILRLRGAFALFSELRSDEGMKAVNAELKKLGAKLEGERL